MCDFLDTCNNKSAFISISSANIQYNQKNYMNNRQKKYGTISPVLFQNNTIITQSSNNNENIYSNKRKNSFSFDSSELINLNGYKKIKYFNRNEQNKEKKSNLLLKKIRSINYKHYLPENDILKKYLVLKDCVDSYAAIIIIEFLFDDREIMILNDFKLIRYIISDNTKIANKYMLNSLKYNNVEFVENIYKLYFKNILVFIDFINTNENEIVNICKIHNDSNKWIVKKIENIIDNETINNCFKILKFLNILGNKDVYTKAMLKYPELISRQLEIPDINATVNELILAINSQMLGINTDNNTFQLLPYNNIETHTIVND
jgi:hypothetical protein